MGKRDKREKELRKMNRAELMEVIYDLRKENEELQAMLDDRTIRMENAGSIALAALELNQVFEAAQKAADDYVDSVMKAYSEQDGGALQNQVDEILASAKRRGDDEAAQILEQAKVQAAKEVEPMRADILKQAEEEAGVLRSQAEEEADALRAQAEEEAYKAHEEAEKLVADAGKEVDEMREDFLAEVTEIMQKHPEIRRHHKTS